MAVTFRDRIDVERGTIGDDGRLQNFSAVATGIPATFWETLVKRVSVEGEVFEATAEAVVEPGTDVKRRDEVVFRDRRWEVLSAFPARDLRGREKFIHLTFREAV